MNLKFKIINWSNEKPTLMFVEFDYKGETVKWYPKWQEIETLLNTSYITETGYNKGKHTYLFLLMCMQLLLDEIQVNYTPNFNPHTSVQISELFNQIRRDANITKD
jgi:hypothetical protein